MLAGGARFWAVDLHIHTPASRDVTTVQYGQATPDDVVAAAIRAGLDAIAVTDHNTVAWCDRVAEAAAGLPLVVLPGVEITTTEGHLLAIWEEGTAAAVLHECLVRLGIDGDDFGKLDIVADFGIGQAADLIAKAGGVAIAAHADQTKGLLQIPTAAHVKKTLLNGNLLAIEIVDSSKMAEIQRKIGAVRTLAFVRGSDALVPDLPGHRLAGIGERRTWVKASRPDLCGLRHAFQDPVLRVRIDDAGILPKHPHLLAMEVSGGFLDGVRFEFSSGLNCLVGGTGTGKSLALECIRFALDQQVDGSAFPHIHSEISSRLDEALGDNGTVTLEVVGDDGADYVIERSYPPTAKMDFVVRRRLEDGELVPLDSVPADLLQISAFSQGEALEYSREKVGRMTLVDASLDLAEIERTANDLLVRLRTNGEELLDQKRVLKELEAELNPEADLKSRVAELEGLFDQDIVKSQKAWKSDQSTVESAVKRMRVDQPQALKLPLPGNTAQVADNQELVDEAIRIVETANSAIAEGYAVVNSALAVASAKADVLQQRWTGRQDAFTKELNEALDAVEGGKSLVALHKQMGEAQTALLGIVEIRKRIDESERPRLEGLTEQRSELLTDLMKARQHRRDLRRKRIKELNGRTNGIVRLDLPNATDRIAFRAKLNEVKVGSRVQDKILDAISVNLHPAQFAEAMLNDSYSDLARPEADIPLEALSRLFVNIGEKDLWSDLLDLQVIDTPDTLDIKFKRDSGAYSHIESLAHGQKCTAIIIVLLADGRAPVIVDQPEDALHAPWIEDYLVDRLRDLRLERQYLFATRSPGIVVSADAEQIITMSADSGSGGIEAAGSLEVHDLNRLVLHHLEGGAEALKRRHQKLSPSLS